MLCVFCKESPKPVPRRSSGDCMVPSCCYRFQDCLRKTFLSDVQVSKKRRPGSDVERDAGCSALMQCLPWLGVAGACALHSWHHFVAAEVLGRGSSITGVSHNLAYPSFAFPLQNFKNK